MRPDPATSAGSSLSYELRMTAPEDPLYHHCLQSRCRSSILMIFLLLTACYPQTGRAPIDDAPNLLRSAHAACLRQDRLGARTLSERLLARHPDEPEAAQAKTYLDDAQRCEALQEFTNP